MDKKTHETSPRFIKVYFVKEYKLFFNKNNKKAKRDYILNVNKIIKDRFNEDFYILNNIQAFLLNYEIKKLLDKAINISNKKYQNIIYINDNMSITGLLNTVSFLSATYNNLGFDFILLDKEDEFRDISYRNTEIIILKNLFE